MSKKKLKAVKPEKNQFDELFDRPGVVPGTNAAGEPLDVLRTVFLSESDWTLRTVTLARKQARPEEILVLSPSGGWKEAGLSTEPGTGNVVSAESVVYVLPSLIAETIVTTRNPVVGKLPIAGRIVPILASLDSDVRRNLREIEERAAKK